MSHPGDNPLSLRCLKVLREYGEPMSGSQVAGHLHERGQPVIHMLSRLCTLNAVKKLKSGDHFVYRLGPVEIPDYEIGSRINGTAKRMKGEGHPKIVRGQAIKPGEIVLPAPVHPLDQAWRDCYVAARTGG